MVVVEAGQPEVVEEVVVVAVVVGSAPSESRLSSA